MCRHQLLSALGKPSRSIMVISISIIPSRNVKRALGNLMEMDMDLVTFNCTLFVSQLQCL